MNRTIGILVTNTDTSDFAKGQPNDGEKFTALMRSVRPNWNYRTYQVKDGELPGDLSECDGYIISGSPASVNDDKPWVHALMDFVRQLDAARKPTVGCCFGHQAIAKALGGEVGDNPGGWGFGVAQTHFNTAEAYMVPKADKLHLFAAHSEQVTKLPPRAVVLGGDDFCPVGSFRVGDHFFTTEFHPEITRDFFDGLVNAFEGYIGREVATEARRQAETPTDSRIFAEWMARFLER
jgi:GMP synthase-like glutamine amidotransferase